MSARVTWDGLAELREQLRNLPADLTDEARDIVTDTANAAAAEVEAGYPSRTGDLRSKVRVVVEHGGQFGVSVVVKNTSPLAQIFESGTQARHTALGANRGAMPPGRVFVPVMVRRRRVMYERLQEILTRRGLTVSGSA